MKAKQFSLLMFALVVAAFLLAIFQSKPEPKLIKTERQGSVAVETWQNADGYTFTQIKTDSEK